MRHRGVSHGFALPTVVITATILLAVMVSVMSTTSSTNTSVSTQYYEGMASDAAESGVAVAKNCLLASGGTASWTNGSPLRPSSVCTGATTCSAEVCFLVFESNVVRTTYTVGSPEVNGSSNTISSIGTVELLRKSDGSVWKRYDHTSKLTSANSGSGGGLSKTIAAGDSHTCALDNAGKIYCWGDNTYGQLGNGTTARHTTPVDISGSGDIVGKAIISVAAGSSYTCALDNIGKVYCWGDNTYGQLGDGTNIQRNAPEDISGSGALAGKIIVGIALSYIDACAIDNTGKVYCWGYNDEGELGNGTTTQSNIPIDISGYGDIAGKDIVGITAGGYHICASSDLGKTYCWGANGNGQLGNGTTASRSTPVDISAKGAISGKTIMSLAAGGFHTCALNDAGKTYCWGINDIGQLGDGTASQRSTPIDISTKGAIAGKTIAMIVAANSHTCALDNAGKTYCWGYNYDGEVGDGASTNRKLPVDISAKGAISGKTIISLAAGAYHTCALDSAGKVYCWGYNYDGQVGDGSITSRATPVKISSSGDITPSVMIVAPSPMAIAVKSYALWF